MLYDKERWNKKYLVTLMPDKTSEIVKKYISLAKVGRAIDIACGTGRNTHFIADNGFEVDAVDFSDYALNKVENRKNINKIEADLDTYSIKENEYELIVKINYLDRKLFPSIIKGLKKDGIFIYETLLKADEQGYRSSSNPEFVLNHNELPTAFNELDVILYEEKDIVNIRGERVKIASFVAKKS